MARRGSIRPDVAFRALNKARKEKKDAGHVCLQCGTSVRNRVGYRAGEGGRLFPCCLECSTRDLKAAGIREWPPEMDVECNADALPAGAIKVSNRFTITTTAKKPETPGFINAGWSAPREPETISEALFLMEDALLKVKMLANAISETAKDHADWPLHGSMWDVLNQLEDGNDLQAGMIPSVNGIRTDSTRAEKNKRVI